MAKYFSSFLFRFVSFAHVFIQVDPDSLCPDVKFIEQMGSLLDDDEHCDVTFFVGPSKMEVKYCLQRGVRLRLPVCFIGR